MTLVPLRRSTVPGRAEPRLRHRRGAAALLVPRRCSRSARSPSALESRGDGHLPPAPRRQGRRAVRDAQAAHDGLGRRDMGAGLAVNEGDSRITRVGAILRRFSLDELPNLSTCCAARCRSSARARPCRCRSTSTPTASAAGSRSSRASPAGRRSTGARRCRGASGSSSTSGTSTTASLRLDLRILALTVRMLATGEGLYKGETGGWKPVE